MVLSLVVFLLHLFYQICIDKILSNLMFSANMNIGLFKPACYMTTFPSIHGILL